MTRSEAPSAGALRERARRAGADLRRRTTPFRVVALLVIAVVFAFYYWTANSGLHPLTVGHHLDDRYNLLTDGFLHGHLGYRNKPPAGLLALPNPYDPVANEQYRAAGLHDVALYKGHLYLYFGPTPALTLFAPFRVLGLGEMSESLAALIYCCAGFVFALLLLRLLIRRYLPDTPDWAKIVAMIGIAAGSAVPFVLRRPVTYEVAISAGYCFSLAALWLFASGGLPGRPSTRRLALGSLCLGLALGARPNLFVLGAIPLALLIYLARSGRLERVRGALALLGPLVACGVLLLIYNKLRFDSFGDFGAQYMMAGANQMLKKGFQLSYIAPGLYFTLVAPAHLTLVFPFWHLPPPPNYPGTLPGGYEVEITGGVLSNLPIALALLALPFLWRRRALSGQGALVIAVLLAAALVVATVVAWTIWGTTMRYELDFATLILIAAFASWFGLLRALQPRRWLRRALAVVGTALVAWGVAYGLAISLVGYDNGLASAHLSTYQSLERFFRKIPTGLSVLTGSTVVTAVGNPAGVQSPPASYTTFGQGPASFVMGLAPAEVFIEAPHNETIYLRAGLQPGSDVHRGEKVSLTASAVGPPVTVPVSGTQRDIPVRLHRGLNDVHLQAAVTPALAPSASVPPELRQVVVVSSLRLARH